MIITPPAAGFIIKYPPPLTITSLLPFTPLPPSPCTIDIYHTVFKPASDSTSSTRLIREAGGVEHNMTKGLKCYAANCDGIVECYKPVCQCTFDADQRDSDLMVQGRHYYTNIQYNILA